MEYYALRASPTYEIEGEEKIKAKGIRVQRLFM